MAVGAGGVIGQAYVVAVGLEPRAGRVRFGKTGAADVRLGQLEGKWPRALCWAPETELLESQSSGLVGGVLLRVGEGLGVVTSYSQAS